MIDDALPEWMHSNRPAFYVQQLVVKASVTPWNASQLNPEKAVKAALSRSFVVQDHIQTVHLEEDYKYICLEVNKPPIDKLLPQKGCLLLSPSRFWNNSIENLYRVIKIHTLFL